MSEDNKINGRVIANARVTGLLNTVIKRVDGVAVNTTAFSTGLLDTYGSAAAAYSVRRLNSAYTGACMRVREDGTNTEADIGFNSAGNVDVLAIREHCGSSGGYVRYWYDQSTAGGTGSGNDAGQATEASQPQIYNGTAVLTENGKPVLTCGNGDQLQFTDNSGTDNTFTAVIHQDATRACLIGNSGGSVALGLADSGSGGSDFGFGTPTYFVDGSSFTFTRGNMYTASLNQILFTAITSDPAQTTLNTGYATATTYYSYNMQELIQWPSDQTSPTNNRPGIETDINDYFSIY